MIAVYLTGFFEVHYLLNGLKKVVVVEKTNMSELDAWLCALMLVNGRRISGRDKPDTLELVKSAADNKGIGSVRWNKLSHFDRRRPSFVIYEDVTSNELILQPKL